MKHHKLFSFLVFLASLGAFVGYTFFYHTNGDTVPPVIHMEDEPFVCSIEATDEELLEGITASDDQDGDLTDSIFVESLSNFIEENTRILNVAVIDQAGNAAKGKRIIQYSDYSSPKFSMTNPLTFYEGTSNITEYIHAKDVIDGDLSSKVKPCSPYHLTYNAGEYPMEFMVSNSAGDISRFTATVTLKEYLNDDHVADIKLSEYLVYTEKGKKVSAWSYVKGLEMNGHVYGKSEGQLIPDTESNLNWDSYPQAIDKSAFKITNDVDYDQEGCYEITYKYDDGTYAGNVRLVVIVE